MRDAPIRLNGHEADADTDCTGRLPKNVRPIHYSLIISPNLNTLIISGLVRIELEVVEDSKSITLHSLDLNIENPIILTDDSSVEISNIGYDKDAQTATLTLSEVLPAGRDVRLIMQFTGHLTEDRGGCFLANTGNRDEKPQYVMVSQMEPIGCRRAFPCFDEPALKATFDTTIIADKALTCLTNMGVKRVGQEGEHLKRWRFNTTPLMSTYLLAFAVGEFNMIETKSFRVPVRLYATLNNNIEHGHFALDLAVKTLEFFEDKLGVSYPLPKMDLLGSPNFAGAMENWGLVMYGEKYIIADEKTAPGATIQTTVGFVQHELAHQWFGNIVTMEYWDGLWLNEGFATWAALYGNNALYPEWKLWQFNLTDDYTKAFQLDSLRSSNPIEVPMKRASDINQAFNRIAYSKGSSVLCMIVKYIGEDQFLAGVQNYLRKHRYGNTVTEDLWDALSEVSGKDIRKFGGIWTRRVGHPVLSVTEGDDWIKVEQNRFLRTGDVRASEDTTLYPISLGLRTSEGIDDLMFDTREITIAKKPGDFFKVNANHVGFYRTLYQPERLDKLVKTKGQLTPEDKFSLISDAAALAASGHQKTVQALELIEHLSDDSECIVWKTLIDAMSAIESAWIFEDDFDLRFRSWQRRIVGPKAHELGWTLSKSDDYVQQQLKILLFNAAIRAGDEKAIGAALHMWTKFQEGDRAAIDPNITAPVFIAALTHGNDPEAVYDIILKEFRAAKSGLFREDALTALGSARQPKLMQQTLLLLLSDEVPNIQVELPLKELCKSIDGLRASLRWLIDNFAKIDKKWGFGMQQLEWVFGPIVGNIASRDVLEEVQDFFKTQSTETYQRQLEQQFDEARVKIAWVGRDGEEVKQWLANNVTR